MRSIVVLARSTSPGVGKTRLRRAFPDEVVDQLTAAFLEDTLDWAVASAEAVIVVHCGDRRGLPPRAVDLHCVAQPRGDLGIRIDFAVGVGFDAGASSVLLVGSDSPDLPPEHVESCWEALAVGAAAIVPASDGGWVALAVRRPLAGCLATVPWSTAATCSETVRALRANGRRTALLSGWHDVDEAADLARLRRALAKDRTRAPRTARLLADLPV